ncbi:hypothetical protein ACVGVM_19820 [Pseudonocardia bannensis]|nr:hypothetical protein [Pseudonocardia bannensis]
MADVWTSSETSRGTSTGPAAATVLSVTGGRIVAIYQVLNPDKLGGL